MIEGSNRQKGEEVATDKGEISGHIKGITNFWYSEATDSYLEKGREEKGRG